MSQPEVKRSKTIVGDKKKFKQEYGELELDDYNIDAV